MQVDPLLREVSEMGHVAFWSRQMAEHGLFVSKALQAGYEELNRLELDGLIEEGRKIYQDWMSIFKKDESGEHIGDIELVPRINESRSYLNKVFSISSKIWIGFAFPAEIEHYLEELSYFEKKVRGISLSEKEELVFWSDVNKDHAALLAHLLDPKEKEIFQQCLLYMDIFDEFKKEANLSLQFYYKLSNTITDFNTLTLTLREYQAIGDLRSVINPLLALHIHREGLRALKELSKLHR